MTLAKREEDRSPLAPPRVVKGGNEVGDGAGICVACRPPRLFSYSARTRGVMLLTYHRITPYAWKSKIGRVDDRREMASLICANVAREERSQVWSR